MRGTLVAVGALLVLLALGAGTASLPPGRAHAVPPRVGCWNCEPYDWQGRYPGGVICAFYFSGSGWNECTQPDPYHCTIGGPGCNVS